jgi:Putative 2/3 transmembrane domain holin
MKLPRMLLWLVLTLVLIVLAHVAQTQLPGSLAAVTLYKAHLLVLGGWVGYWLDRALFPYARPHQLLDVFDEDTPAKAYASYCEQGGGKTFDGKPLPSWDELGENRQDCWHAAALEVYKAARDPFEFDNAMLRRAIIVAACVIAVCLGA